MGVKFTNSDPDMIVLFLKWINNVLRVPKERVIFEIYLHENNLHRKEEVRRHWASVTGYSVGNFNRIYLKRNKIKTNRKNTGNLYYGILRVNISASSGLNRQITGWINGVIKNVSNCG